MNTISNDFKPMMNCLKFFSVHNGGLRRSLPLKFHERVAVLRGKVPYSFALEDFLLAGWAARDFAWYQAAVPRIGEQAAIRALHDGHTDYVLVGNLRSV